MGKCFAAVRKTASVRTRTVTNGARTTVLAAVLNDGGANGPTRNMMTPKRENLGHLGWDRASGGWGGLSGRPSRR